MKRAPDCPGGWNPRDVPSIEAARILRAALPWLPQRHSQFADSHDRDAVELLRRFAGSTFSPSRVLDIGAAAGPLVPHLLRAFPSARLTLLEPGLHTHRASKVLLGDAPEACLPIPTASGVEMVPVPYRPMLPARRVEYVNDTLEHAGLAGQYDLVINLSVVDRIRGNTPRGHASLSASLVAPGGFFLLGSPLDWEAEIPEHDRVRAIEDLLPGNRVWAWHGVAELEFRMFWQLPESGSPASCSDYRNYILIAKLAG